MKALILAGGFGTRLRPLTCTRSKLMFPIANRPLLDWILESLARSGVKKVVMAVNYMAEAIERSFGTSKYGMRLEYSRETMPLGTGGPIKRAETMLDEDDDPFFVLNGDILSTVDYADLYKRHMSFKAEATIALYEVDDPSRFGVVEINGRSQILKFVEKPQPEEAPSRLVNAGVYVLKQSVIEGIPPAGKVSLEREIFPVLAERGGLYGHRFDGFWVDIGKPNDYIIANKMMLDLVAGDRPLLSDGVKIHPEAKIHLPVALGKGVTIEEGACIGPYASIGDRVTMGKGTRVQESVVFPGAWVGNFTSIKGAIIGEEAILGQWVKIEERCIVGDYVNILDNVTLTQKVKICHSKEVDSSILGPETVM
ncbi:MAG: sugar phosphate nucleotidyltransferase [Candidatus Bathyarchaeia archaeon]